MASPSARRANPGIYGCTWPTIGRDARGIAHVVPVVNSNSNGDAGWLWTACAPHDPVEISALEGYDCRKVTCLLCPWAWFRAGG